MQNNKVCQECGNIFTPRNKQESLRRKYCSRSCNGKVRARETNIIQLQRALNTRNFPTEQRHATYRLIPVGREAFAKVSLIDFDAVRVIPWNR